MVQERQVRVERRLSAILAADVAGYSRLMHDDEEGTHAKLSTLLTEAVHPAIAEHGGRIVNEARSAAQAGLALNPNFTIRRWRVSDNPAHLAAWERLYEGLRLAGVPEG